MAISDRNRFVNDLADVQSRLAELADRIDDLGDLGDAITGDTAADQLACYASNTLQGAQALLREMERMVLRKPKRKGRRR